MKAKRIVLKLILSVIGLCSGVIFFFTGIFMVMIPFTNLGWEWNALFLLLPALSVSLGAGIGSAIYFPYVLDIKNPRLRWSIIFVYPIIALISALMFHFHFLDKDTLYSKKALEKQSPYICKKIKDNFKRNECYTKLAAEKEDPSLCNNVGAAVDTAGGWMESFDKRRQIKECYSQCAIKMRNPGVCEQVEIGFPDEYSKRLRAECYFEMAKEMQDVGLCGKIENSDINNKCLAVLKKDSALCASAGYEKNECYREIEQARK